jgi:phosphatidylethanolamine-binding protein (PEBP) family uncharacterized protein
MGHPSPAAPRPSRVPRIRRATWATLLLVLLAAVALAGCGTGTGATETNALAPKEPTKLSFTSSAIHGRALPALYTCDGKNTWPSFSWGKVPAGVEELALFAVGTRRLSNGRAEVSVDWALAGLNPSLHGLRAGEIPRGAFLVANSKGEKRYSICPARGQTERYTFALLALPRYARAARGFPGPNLLQNLTGTDVEYQAPAAGTFSVKYTRR